MTRKMWWFGCVLVFVCGNLIVAQTVKPAGSVSSAQLLDAWIGNAEKKLEAVAEAMPADKYSFVPAKGEFKGARSFGEQVRHVAAANYGIGSAILGIKPPEGTGHEVGPESIRGKEEIAIYLRDSFVLLHRAVASISEAQARDPIPSRAKDSLTGTRLGLAADAIDHAANHYGQLVEYLRMNGIVPPDSR